MSKKKPKPTEQNTESQPSVLQAAEQVLGVGLGAAGGIAVGAVLGAVGGPPGVVVGAVAGAMAGGLAGEALAELADTGFDDRHWQEHFQSRGHSPADYDHHRPAYQYGWLARRRFGDQSFEDVEEQLRQQWEGKKDAKRLPWGDVKDAAQDAWNAAPPARPRTTESRQAHDDKV
jgi:phage tail tape-measure protein